MEIDRPRQSPASPPAGSPLPPFPPIPPAEPKAPPIRRDTASLSKVRKAETVALTVTSGFGSRADPFTGRRRSHHGIDLAVPEGTPVRATRSGKVTYAGPAEGYGAMVIIDHGQGVESHYGHTGQIRVAVGQTVRAGQTLAKVATIGRSTGPHLHFEIRRNGRAVDPWRLLAGGQSRVWRPPV